MDRRQFLLRGAGVAGSAVGVVRSLPAAAQAGGGLFQHGVASGDPLADAVVIWTRVTTASPEVAVSWTVARDESLTQPVATGEAVASAAADHTVKVDVTGLDPATTYHYGFEVDGERSPVGRTRTAPDGAAERLRIGVVSCGRFATGYFNAYGRLAEREVDLVLHLGDYIYEDGSDAVRDHRPRSWLRTLQDYRSRYAQHRTDPDLQELHRRHPMACIWDDHELAGNAWRDGARDHADGDHGPWPERRALAAQAWREWLPVRLPDPADPLRIWRHLPLGGLAEVVLLDTRLHGRDEQAGPAASAEVLRDPTRRLLGDEQTAWLEERLASSTATWRIIGNQVVFAPLAFPAPIESIAETYRDRGMVVEGSTGWNPDQWDGYVAERERVLAAVDRHAVRNVVVLSGDIHCSLVHEVGPGVVELVTPSVTSANFDELIGAGPAALLETALRGANAGLRYAELQSHGYLVLDLDADRLQADWWFVETVDRRDRAESHGTSWVVDAADETVAEAPEPTVDPEPPSPPLDAGGSRGDGAGDGGDGDRVTRALGGAGLVAAAGGALVAIRRRRGSS